MGELKRKLNYDQITGIFIWKKSNKRAGYVNNNGYSYIKLNQKMYRTSKLAWYYVTGEWPTEIDHKNGIRSDDRFSNLRLCSRSQNNMNKSKQGNSCLPKWVRKGNSKSESYQAILKIDGKTKCLGTYDTPEEAHVVAAKFAKEVHGDFFKAS